MLRGDVGRVLGTALDEPFDLVVLDPPREGARSKVVTHIGANASRAVATSLVTSPPGATWRPSPSSATRWPRSWASNSFPMT